MSVLWLLPHICRGHVVLQTTTSIVCPTYVMACNKAHPCVCSFEMDSWYIIQQIMYLLFLLLPSVSSILQSAILVLYLWFLSVVEFHSLTHSLTHSHFSFLQIRHQELQAAAAAVVSVVQWRRSSLTSTGYGVTLKNYAVWCPIIMQHS